MISSNVEKIKSKLEKVCLETSIDASSVQIIAVSKNHKAEAVKEAYLRGLFHFGENRLQEALPKIELLKNLPIVWHFLGKIQSNKIKKIFQSFDWIQSVDSIEILDKANKYLEQANLSKPIFLQINISRENSKSGFTYSEVEELAKLDLVKKYPNLRFCGLMGIGPLEEGVKSASNCFKEFSQFHKKIRRMHESCQFLSMGMTHDFDVAVRYGSNMIRVGTGIFGERPSLD